MRLTLPLRGVWTGDVEVDTHATMKGAKTISIDSALSLAAFIRRGAAYMGGGSYRLVGGAGGFPSVIQAKSYVGTTVRTVATDILNAVGERLSSASDGDVLGASLAKWTTFTQSAMAAFSSLIDSQPDVSWRVLPDGSVWVGRELWPAVNAPGDVLEQDVDLDRATLDLVKPNLIPGVAISGRKISVVEYLFSRETTLRARVWMDN